MIYKRLIPVLLHKNGKLVRSKHFNVHQIIGNPILQTNRYKTWDLDELIYLDISADWCSEVCQDNRESFVKVIQYIAKHCFVPLSVGGGIRSLEDIRKLLHAGADRVIINSHAIDNPDFIQSAARTFGSQAIIISVDAIWDGSDYAVVTGGGRRKTGMKLREWVSRICELGAGEIFLNNVDRDGLAIGYDIDMIKCAVSESTIPLIACGGAGKFTDFIEPLVSGGATASAAANIFNFTETSYYFAKMALVDAGLKVRPINIVDSDSISQSQSKISVDNSIWDKL